MKSSLYVPVIIIVSLLGCKKEDIEKDIPDCVRQNVKELIKQACKEGASAKEYTFQQKTVYVLSPGNCGADMSAKVIDAECTNLGYLGGIDGNTKINGEEFATATFQRTIWEE